MGVVRRAWDRELHRVVALKFLRVGPQPDPGFARRLMHEAQALARLAHPNVVAVYDVGPAEDSYYVAMEYIRGADVLQWLAQEQPQWRAIVSVFVQVAHGLAAAHDAGLVHRDVKPSNVVLGEDGRARVVDFGLALARAGAGPRGHEHDAAPRSWSSTATPPGSVLGTPGYTAPEQIAGAPADAASDQFAWCVSLFEALWHRRPYDATALQRAAAGAALPWPSQPPPRDAVPRWLLAILRRGLQADPTRRWPSMRALAAAIEARLARRSRAPWLLGTVALGTIAAALALPRAEAAPLCRADADAPWPRDGGTALALAFGRSDAPFAATAADHAIARLDRWSQRWDEARATVCSARQSASPAALRCLEHSAADARATFALLSEATPDVVAHATDAVAALDDPTTCLRATEAPAQLGDDAIAARRSIEDAIAQAAASNRAGRAAEAADALAAIVAQLQPDESAIDLRARARLRLGDALHDLSREQAAHDALADAYFEALRVDDPRTATEALIMLVLVDGERLGHSDDAARWARHAHALLAAAALGPRIEGRLLQVEAAAHVVRGQPQAAIEAATAALDRFATAADTEPLDVAWTLHTLANARQEAREFAAALADHERARAMAAGVLGEGHPDLQLVDSGIAGDLLALGRGDEARARYEAVLARLQRDGDPAAIARAHNNLAVTFEALARPDDAEAHYRSAVAAYEAAGASAWPAAAATLYNLGHLHYRRGRVREAADDFRRCLELRRGLLEPDHPALAATTTALAAALEDSGEFDEALALHLAALELRERIDPAALAVGHALFNLGLHHDKRGQFATAAQWLERALEHAREHHHDDFAAEAAQELARVQARASR